MLNVFLFFLFNSICRLEQKLVLVLLLYRLPHEPLPPLERQLGNLKHGLFVSALVAYILFLGDLGLGLDQRVEVRHEPVPALVVDFLRLLDVMHL